MSAKAVNGGEGPAKELLRAEAQGGPKGEPVERLPPRHQPARPPGDPGDRTCRLTSEAAGAITWQGGRGVRALLTAHPRCFPNPPSAPLAAHLPGKERRRAAKKRRSKPHSRRAASALSSGAMVGGVAALPGRLSGSRL